MEIIQVYPFKFGGDTIPFYILDQLSESGEYMKVVSLRVMCEVLGIDLSSQRRRILDDPAIAETLYSIDIPYEYDRGVKGQREQLMLDFESVPYWLGTIQISRVRPELQERMLHYKKDFVRAAYAAFRSRMIPADVLAEMDAYKSDAERTYSQLMDDASRLRADIDEVRGISTTVEEELVGVVEDLREVQEFLDELAVKVKVISDHVLSEALIDDWQQKKIQDMIKDLAGFLFKRDPGSPYGKYIKAVYNQFYSAFTITSYQMLKANDFEQAERFLTELWHTSTGGARAPESYQRQRPHEFLR